MQFAFTEEQELLRREAREALGNGGWSREDIAAAELGFVDQAILYEEAWPRELGESSSTRPGPSEALDCAGARGGRHLAEGARPRRRVRKDKQFGRKIGVYQAVSHARTPRRDRARSFARLLGSVVGGRGRRAGADRGGGREGVRERRGRGRLRAVDPGQRRHRLHLGARAARVLQAGALDPGVRRLPARRRARIAAWLLD